MVNVVTWLARDSRRLEALLEVIDRYVASGDLTTAKDAFAHFDERLRARIRIEEEVVFPMAEKAVQEPRFAATARMKREHLVVLDLLAAVADGFASRHSGLQADVQELRAAVRLHFSAEHETLGPILAAIHPDAAAEHLFA
jgi:hypothetical protein